MSVINGRQLKCGQHFSSKYEGFIYCKENIYRKPAFWNGKKINHYYLEVTCTNCGGNMLQNRANFQKESKPFCTKTCKKLFLERKSFGNILLKKRKHGEGFHVLVKNHGHHRASNNGTVYQHILVAEEKIGRKILINERVHHINCVKNDNRPENLFVCKDDKEHFLIHGSLNKCVEKLINSGKIYFNQETKKYETLDEN